MVLNETLTSLELDPRFGIERGQYFTFRAPRCSSAPGGYAIVDGQAVVMGVPAVVRQNRLFIPLSFMREQFGVSVDVPAAFVEPGVRARARVRVAQPRTRAPSPSAARRSSN